MMQTNDQLIKLLEAKNTELNILYAELINYGIMANDSGFIEKALMI